MTAYELPRERTYGNFRQRKPKQKQVSAETKREREAPGHLTLVRKLPCCICDEPAPSQAHHLKATGERGVGKKSGNRWCVPMCHECHLYGVEKVGSRKEVTWFLERGISPLDLAAALFASNHSLEAMQKVLNEHRVRRDMRKAPSA